MSTLRARAETACILRCLESASVECTNIINHLCFVIVMGGGASFEELHARGIICTTLGAERHHLSARDSELHQTSILRDSCVRHADILLAQSSMAVLTCYFARGNVLVTY
jgi:hypothetical protein